jgi:hypothetical protein
MLTDGAGYNSDGVIKWLGRKVEVAKSVPFAVATRGPADLGNQMRRFLCDSVDRFGIDAFMDRMPEFLSDMQARPEIAEALVANPMEVVMAGFSPARGAFRLKFETHGENAYVLREPDTVEYGGPLDTDPTPFVRLLEPGETAESWIRTGGLAFMEACRHQIGTSLDGSREFYAIGGQIDLTIVAADGVTVETLRTWPEDVIGEKIEPAGGAA